MSINIYINFNGNCREAVAFYAKVFGAEQPQIMSFSDIPEDPQFALSEKEKNLVMHTYLHIHGSKVMFSDVLPGIPYVAGNNISLTIISKDKAELKRLFDQLKEEGHVELELQETFWSQYYGYVTDKFGIQWQLNFDQLSDSKLST
ncbi:VOC family protein [Sporomusaceae bacterium FL31]|nr:VOC family protein [Sporomusaceae bacterium FL31]GCE35302.1 VOC family protein [Sporomusaceae bacterium]